MKSGKRGFAAAAAAIMCAVFAPSASAAVTGAVTGDDGNPVVLAANGAAAGIRNMDVQAFVHVDNAADAHSWAASVADPAGVGAASAMSCSGSSYWNDDHRYVTYRGNGTYKLTVTTYSDNNCTTAPKTYVYSWTVAASVGVGAPAGVLMTRPANSFSTNTQLLDFAGTPGGSYEIKYELNGVVNPDGSLGGVPKDAYVDSQTGKVSISERTPGTYVVVARAKNGDYYTPWSPPITMRLIAPFDFSTLSFPDSIGPSYQTRGVFGETSAGGKVSVAYAVGKKGKHFHGLGTAKVNSKGVFTRRFRLTKTGWYRLRFKYAGSATVAGGTIYDVVRIRRHRL